MRALLAQLTATPGDVERNASRVVDSMERFPDVEIAVFPELYLCGYAPSIVRSGARPPDSLELGMIAEAAARRRTAVVVGFAETRGADVFNSAACFDNTGELVAVYRKAQLFGAERDHFVPGEVLVVAALAARRVGILICFDIEFPELARSLAIAGADLLITPSANMSPYYGVHDLASRARALDNRVPHIYVNLVGRSNGFEFVGGSRAIGSDGQVLDEAPHRSEELIVANIPRPEQPSDPLVDYLSLLPSPLPVLGSERLASPDSTA